MEIWQAVLLGIIQGITEWFPVSSSGHLVLTKNFLGLGPSLLFDVFIHFGSAAVVALIFREEVINVFKSFFSALVDLPKHGFQSFYSTGDRKLTSFIIIASIPTGFIGLIVSNYYEGILSDPFIVGFSLIITGFVLLSTRKKNGNRNKEDMKTSDALIIGIMQGLAAVPGISRSGFTISSSLLRDLDRKLAARYSFLLFLPAIIAAGFLKLLDLPQKMPDLFPLIIGTLTAMVVGYITIKLLLKLIEKGSFYIFSGYCLVLGITVIIISL